MSLHNIQYLCPNFVTILINTYRRPSRLFIIGGGEISSSEGTTQGDTLAMAFYGISTTLLISKLDYTRTDVHQVWLADDATGAGSLQKLRLWWDLIKEEGKKIGYIVKPSKSWLILKNPSQQTEAETMFADSPIKVTTSGKRHLGAAIGTDEFKENYLMQKVEEWCNSIRYLTKIAASPPQAADSILFITPFYIFPSILLGAVASLCKKVCL